MRRPLPCAKEKRTAKMGSLLCAGAKNARQSGLFAVRRGTKCTAINGTFAVHPYKRTTKALFLLLVLVTLPWGWGETQDKK
jgi:hypothetical protein